jgi:uncharacterized protein YbjQ (UPF0145 family)
MFTTDKGLKEFTSLGLIVGNSVKTRSASTDISASIKKIRGGKINSYKQLMSDTRMSAMEDLYLNAIKNFEKFDAICNIKFSTTEISNGSSEIIVYGTVIKYK